MTLLKKKAQLLSTLALALLVNLTTKAQWELGTTVTPSLGTFLYESQSLTSIPALRLSGGLNANYHLGRFFISTGVLHLSQGQKLEVFATTTSNPEGTGETFDQRYRVNTLALPLLLNFKVYEGAKTSFFAGAGIAVGYNYRQQVELLEDVTINRAEAKQPFEDVRLFEDLYSAVTAGIGWRQRLSEKLNLQVRPNVFYHLNQQVPDPPSFFRYRLLSWGLEVGVFYHFGRGK